MSARENGIYRFADCELGPVEHRLLAHGQPVPLRPKVFETLVLLVERAGHVVSKDELMAALRPRGFVRESNLTKHIWLIRRASGDGTPANTSLYTNALYAKNCFVLVLRGCECSVLGCESPDMSWTPACWLSRIEDV